MEDKPERRLSWTLQENGNDATVVFEGELNENFIFDKLVDRLSEFSGTLTFDLAGIRRANSVGVRQWVNFMRGLAEVEEIKEILYVRCSVAVVSQINMIHEFHGNAKILSVYAPYAHSETGDEEQRLLEVKDITDPSNPPVFKDDDGEWELDELPERYFEFMRS